MKIRNPNAMCGNCPYWLQDTKPDDKNRGLCCRTAALRYGDDGYGSISMNYYWCGEHPDFWTEEEAPRTDPNEAKIREAVRLMNEGERSEAMKVFREMHGLVNRFVCGECGHVSASAHGLKCAKCGAWPMQTHIVHDPGVLAMQALAETDEEDDSWKYRTCRECKHRGSMCGCGRFYLGRTLEFIPDKNNCPLFKEGDPDEKEES